jgi:hypothetical protein
MLHLGRPETPTRWPEEFPCAVETGVEEERMITSLACGDIVLMRIDALA